MLPTEVNTTYRDTPEPKDRAMSDLSRSEESRYDLGLLFTDGMVDLDDASGYRGAVAARRWTPRTRPPSRRTLPSPMD